MRCRRVALLLGLSALAFGVEVSAQTMAATGVTGAGYVRGRGRFWAEVGFHDQEAVTGFPLMVGLDLSLSRATELEVIVPIGLVNFAGEGGGGAGFGSVFLGLHVHDARSRWTLGVGLPNASSDGGELFIASLMHGTQDIHLWSPDTLSLVGRLRNEFGSTITLAFDVAGMFLIPTADRAVRDEELVLQPAGELSVQVTPLTSIGTRLALVWVPTSDSADDAQLSLGPFIMSDFSGSLLSLQLLMNLDEPYGFAFDEGGYWGLFLGLAGTL